MIYGLRGRLRGWPRITSPATSFGHFKIGPGSSRFSILSGKAASMATRVCVGSTSIGNAIGKLMSASRTTLLRNSPSDIGHPATGKVTEKHVAASAYVGRLCDHALRSLFKASCDATWF